MSTNHANILLDRSILRNTLLYYNNFQPGDLDIWDCNNVYLEDISLTGIYSAENIMFWTLQGKRNKNILWSLPIMGKQISNWQELATPLKYLKVLNYLVFKTAVTGLQSP